VKIIRRLISILFYLLAGMFLLSTALIAFVEGQGDLPKAATMGFLGGFALVPLGLGALISPGRRGREIGIVLLVVAGWTTFTGVSMAVMLMDPKFVAMMPPESRHSFEMFNDFWFGTAFTVLMGVAGVWLVRRKDKSSQTETISARARRIFG
jgi:hypothetical protein